jgi:iron complex outermembrane recepter protein
LRIDFFKLTKQQVMKNRSISIIAIACLLFPLMAWAQSDAGGINGKILDPESGPVAFANVVLYMRPDSAIAKVEYSDAAGNFRFANLPAGEYWLDVSFIGMNSYTSPVLRLADRETIDLPTIQLADNTAELAEVVVTGRKPVLELKSDRIVFNVEKSITAAGTNALELLKKAPGVLLDNKGNISMMGQSGVIIAINGKNSPLRGEDLTAYLRTLQADQIEAIELINDPGASFEAMGNAGIINIRLKKADNLGANGNIALGYSIGEMPRYNGALSGNYRNDIVNLFGSYSYNSYQNPYTESIDIRRRDVLLDQSVRGNIAMLMHSFKTGMDLSLSPKSVLGFMAVGSLSEWDWRASTRTNIGSLGNGLVDSILIAQSHTVIDRTDLSFNLNYRFENEQGVVLNMDADYASYYNDRQNTQPNEFRAPSNSEILAARTFFTDSPTDIAIATFRIDYERPLGKGKLGAGLKGSYVNSDNIFDFYNIIDGELIVDVDRTNQFVYQENVNAAYLSFNGPLGEKIDLSAGLRGEHTNSTGSLTGLVETQDKEVKRNYFDLFPSLRLDYRPDQNHSLQFSYSRRINRPPYQQLNPFQFKVDELSYIQGNPFLQPEYANTLRLQHSFRHKLTTTLTYRSMTDLIAQLYEARDDNFNVYSTVNLASQNYYSINFGAPTSFTSWWSAYSSLTAFYVENKGTLQELTIDRRATSLNLSMQNTFQLPAGLNAEVSGFYNSPTLWGANEEVGSIWSVDVGVEKSIFNGKGTLGLSVTDLFWTNIWPYASEFGPTIVDYTWREDSRRFNINLSYGFGNSKVKGARKRARGLEEEKNRIK